MASARTQTTGNIKLSGTTYSKHLEARQIAMKAFEAGTVNEDTMKAARAVVRQDRKLITSTGMTVTEWRAAEELRQAKPAKA